VRALALNFARRSRRALEKLRQCVGDQPHERAQRCRIRLQVRARKNS